MTETPQKKNLHRPNGRPRKTPLGRPLQTAHRDVRAYFRELLGPGWQMRLDEYFTETPIAKMKPYLVELAYHYAYGKPREKLEISAEVKTVNLSILATEDLRTLKALLEKAREVPALPITNGTQTE